MDASRDRTLLLFRFLANLGPESAQEAVTELFRLAESRPDDLELRITLGRVLLQIRGPEEALAQFESALREHGESATQVVPFLDQIVDRSPACAVRVFQLYTTLPAEVDGHSLVRLARLRALLTLQRWKEAREELRALDAGGEEEIVREAIRSVEAALRSAPEAGILRQALIELHLGREEYGDAAARLEELGQCGREWVPRAIELYRTALQTAPGALLLWESFLGTCCNHGMYAVAIIEAEKALAVLSPPEAGVVLRWLGTCYLEEGNLSQAVACIQDSVRRNEACAPAAEQELQRILAIDPSHAGCRLALGRLLLLRGEAKEAADHLREAIRFDPGSMAQVIEELKDASRRLTGETNIRLALGELLEARGDFEEALQVYEELLEQDSASVDLLRPRLEFACREAPRNARAHLLLGKACARTKDVASACRFLFHAATLDTRSSEAVLKELRTIEQIEPSSSEPKLYLAEVYFRKGLIDAGMELLGQAVRTDPSSGPRVRVRLEKLRERHAENAALQLGLAALGANSAG
jgi:tetratricopeptide (TPR) repeat protein